MFQLPFLNIDFPYFIVSLYVVEFIFAITIIFIERKNPSSTIAWVMIIFILPIGGMILYLLLSQNIARQKIFKLSAHEQDVVEKPLENQILEMKEGVFQYSDEEESLARLITLNQVYGKSFLTQENKVEILNDGVKMFDSILRDIRNAREYVNVQYFIVKNDETGKKLLRTLVQVARKGVKVRFLVDALGTKNLDKVLLNEFAKYGGKIAYFFSPRFIKINLRFNYRNHRKIVIVDGRVGYVGGFNIGNEYLGKKKKFGYWRDTHIRVQGRAINDLNARFILDWRLTAKENLGLEQAYFDFSRPVGKTSMQIVNSGPDSERQEVKHAYLKMINSAEKSIHIQTPYFVPDESIFTAIQTAAFAGIDVKIMIPNIRDHILVYWATYYYCGLLLKAGVKVYIYENGFLHAKTLSVDGKACSVGSANFDIRSFKLNFETNAFLYDQDVTSEMDRLYFEDLGYCRELTMKEYENRSLIIRIKEGIAKLSSDIL